MWAGTPELPAGWPPVQPEAPEAAGKSSAPQSPTPARASRTPQASPESAWGARAGAEASPAPAGSPFPAALSRASRTPPVADADMAAALGLAMPGTASPTKAGKASPTRAGKASPARAGAEASAAASDEARDPCSKGDVVEQDNAGTGDVEVELNGAEAGGLGALGADADAPSYMQSHVQDQLMQEQFGLYMLRNCTAKVLVFHVQETADKFTLKPEEEKNLKTDKQSITVRVDKKGMLGFKSSWTRLAMLSLHHAQFYNIMPSKAGDGIECKSIG